LKKALTRCPFCEDQPERDDCTLAASRRTVDGGVQVCCCEALAKKDKRE